MANIRLTWTESTTDEDVVASYHIFRKSGSGPFQLIANHTDLESLEYLDEDLEPNITYQYYLRTVLSNGNVSDKSNTITLTPATIIASGSLVAPDAQLSGAGDVESGDGILFVAVSTSAGSGAQVMTSEDGINWEESESSIPVTDWRAVAWDDTLELFCAVGSGGASNRSMTSPDGLAWTGVAILADSLGWVAMTNGVGEFAAVTGAGGFGNESALTTNGTSWTDGTPQSRAWEHMAYSPTLDLYVACASVLSGARMGSSPDGLVWTLRGTTVTTSNFVGVCWSPELEIFVAVGLDGSGGVVWISDDGTTWTAHAVAAVDEMVKVCWSPTLELFAATCFLDGNWVIATSEDGINWTLPTIPASSQNWRSIAWSETIGLFVAFSSSTSGTQRVMTSPDGVNWTLRDTPENTRSYVAVCANG